MDRRLTVLAVGAFSLACTAACLGGGEVDLAELEVDHALTCEFSTPHTPWARPYALGKTRVLFFTKGQGTAPRECVELLQRFDLAAQAVFWAQIVDSDSSHWHGGEVGRYRMLNLLHQKWDCFVFLDVPVSALGPEEQYRMLKAVTEGAGLVLTGSSDARILKEKNRLTTVPFFLKADRLADAYAVGRGRGIRLPSRPSIPYSEGWTVEDDYWHERLGRAVLWAAGKEPRAELSLGVSKPAMTRTEKDRSLTARLTGRRADGARLELCIRRAADEPIRWSVPVSPATDLTTVESSIPVLPAGAYHVDARLLSSAGVEAWATAAFQVLAPQAVAELSLARDWGEIGAHIAGSVRISGPLEAGETVRVRLLDRRRRELLRRDLPPEGRPEFDFPIEPWMPMLVTVESQLRQRDAEIARACTYFHVTKRNRGRFNFVIWDVPSGTLAPYAEEALARTGMTIQLHSPPSPPPYVAAFEVAYLPYTTRILATKTAQGIMQPFCWNDQAAVDRHVSQLAQRYLPARQHGVFAYSLGDENTTLGCCLSPECAEAYRRYLRETYGTLEALNRSWGTTLGSWQEVGLSNPDDNEETTALAAKNYPRWFDRQAFKSYNYVQFCRRHAEAFAAIDPQAKTGFEGAGTFSGGDDLDLIVRSLKFWSPYPGTADEVLRSIAPRAMPRANWMGYTKDADSLLAKYWRMVVRGSDAVWWWRWDCIGAFHGWLAPDLRPYPAVKEILQDTQIARDGLGDLLLQSTMLDDGIAMLYSYPSTFAQRLEEGPGYGGYESAHLRVHETLRELGYQFRYVTDRMMRLGEFDAARYKVLILSRADAIGDRQSEVIRRFVEGGGTVIADVLPGRFDDHCKPRPHGALDDLFGIVREPKPRGKTATLTSDGKQLPAFRLEKMLVDPGVKLAGAKAAALADADGVPAVIVNRLGKGKAVLLNFAMSSFPRLGVAGTPADAEALFSALLLQCGLKPAAGLRDPAGDRVRGTEVVRWQNGRAEIWAIFREGGLAQEARLTFDTLGPRWVYDLRHHQSLGRQSGVSTTIVPNRASFFVLCKGPAPAARLVLDTPAANRGTLVKMRVSVPDAEGLHALRIRARVGDRPLDWLDQNLVVGREPRQIEIPVAYNDPPGEYDIRAIDLFSNESVTARLTVR